ncbi:MAG: redoxin domain-containing protein [Bacteroidetes bacterium]|nr:redoxin domain-containing protein [Bacteroidota bacterium]
MKRICFLLTALLVFTAACTFAQDKKEKTKDADTLPYQKDPNLPAFEILELDSTTVFNSFNIPEGKPFVLFFFGAECGHCEQAFETLQKGWDSLQTADFYMMSFSPIYQIKEFAKKYHLDQHKNIKLVGMDQRMFFTGYYGVRAVPFIAVYDKHRKLVKAWNTHVSVKELWEEIQKKSPYKEKKKKKK